MTSERPSQGINSNDPEARKTNSQNDGYSKYNKRANLPLSIMDQEIDQYTATLATVTTSSQQTTGKNESTSTAQKMTDYEKWVRRLYATNLFLPVKLGLENMERIHEALGYPMGTEDERGMYGDNDSRSIVVVHVAGTNGKGSVTYKIAKTLELANPSLVVGLFTSPHVSSFRERMQINNGRYITEDEVVQLLPRIYEICQTHDIPATFFEITTALAFAFYRQKKCDVVVLETGLGGRLDATNIIKQPALSIITSIGLEHTRILGDTVELIAVEKAGIMKPNCPVLVGPNVPHAVLRQCAIDKNVSQYFTCEDVLGSNKGGINDGTLIEDDYDLENSRIATAALKLLQKSRFGTQLGLIDSLTPEIISSGTSVRPPCRFELLDVPQPNKCLQVILDVAHNPPAMEYLKRKLQKTFPSTKFRIVVGMSSDKDLKLSSEIVLEIVNYDLSRIHLVEAAHPRAAKLEDILRKAPGFAVTDESKCDLNNHQQGITVTDDYDRKGTSKSVHYNLEDRSITTQLKHAIQLMSQQNQEKASEEILVVCGSVFLMSEAREALGIDEPRDSDVISEVAGAGFRHSQENFGNSQNSTDKL